MGLLAGFARLVVLCGHGSDDGEQPIRRGARVWCMRGQPRRPQRQDCRRDPQRRRRPPAARRARHRVPPDTWFMAAEHDTATDRVTVLDSHSSRPGHERRPPSLSGDLAAAGTLPEPPSAARPPRRAEGTDARSGNATYGWRSSDWAQVFPEWGLAGNAAFIVGPREITAALDLERRVFLHSLRRRSTIRTDRARDDPHRAAGGRPVDQLPVLLLDCRPPIVLRRRNKDDPQRRRLASACWPATAVICRSACPVSRWPTAGTSSMSRCGCWQSCRRRSNGSTTSSRATRSCSTSSATNGLHLAARATAAEPWQRHTPHGWRPWARQGAGR